MNAARAAGFRRTDEFGRRRRSKTTSALAAGRVGGYPYRRARAPLPISFVNPTIAEVAP
jgi:hypothetical protein